MEERLSRIAVLMDALRAAINLAEITEDDKEAIKYFHNRLDEELEFLALEIL